MKQKLAILLAALLLLCGCAARPDAPGPTDAAGAATLFPITKTDAPTPDAPETAPVPVTETDPEISAMLPVLDSLVRAMGVAGGNAYAPEDPVFFWNVLYLTCVNWNAAHPGISIDGDAVTVTRDAMRAVAGAAFSDTDTLLPQPDGSAAVYTPVTYDAQTGVYRLMQSDAGAADTRLETCRAQPDGTVAVTLGLYVDPDERYGAIRFTLRRNPNAAGLPAPAFPYCVVDAAEDEAPFAAWYEVEIGKPFSADLDCDGTEETIEIAMDENDLTAAIVTVSDGGVTIENADMGGLMFARAYVADIEAGDGYRELVITGDMASDDYTTYIYRYGTGALRAAEFFGEAVGGIGNGRLTVHTVVNVFGTYGASCTFAMGPDLTFARESPYWVGREGGMPAHSITLQRDGLPVTAHDGRETTLPKGAVLTLAATDEESYAELTDGDGNAYRVRIARAEDEWQWRIGGVPEGDWFGELMYAG